VERQVIGVADIGQVFGALKPGEIQGVS